jgi:outer membrane protein assembly factor BamB/O-antigen ligase
VEHADAAQVAALVGALGAVLVLLPRGRIAPLAGFALLGTATALLGWSLVGDEDLELLVTEPTGITLLVVGALTSGVLAVPLARYPTIVPVALLAVAPFRIPVELGEEEAFLLLPFYLVLSSAVLAFAYRAARGWRPPSLPFVLALPLVAFVAYTALSFLWTHDEREGAVALAFFLFPFVAALGVVARSPLASWLSRALTATIVALGVLFAAIGLYQAETRTLIFARDVEVANAYTTFFRVTSLFKDPSLYGRYLVIPIAVLLVALWIRRGRLPEWLFLGALVAFLFAGLYYSYSQSSFVTLFCVAFAVAFLGARKRLRILLLVCAAVAALGAALFAAQAVQGRSLKDVTSSRSRLVTITLDAFELSPVTGVGVGGQPRASGEAIGTDRARRNASHTTPLTVLSELGVVGFVLYLWLLVTVVLALLAAVRTNRTIGLGLSAVLLVLFVHSLLYAGFFEDPLTWGAVGLTAAVLAYLPRVVPLEVTEPAPRRLAHWNLGRLAGRLSMPRALKWILLAITVLVVLLAGAAAALWLANRDRPQGALDTELRDVTVSVATKPEPSPKPKPQKSSDRRCWNVFGANPARSLARPLTKLGPPVKKPLWSRVLTGYIEFPPAYCDGMLYVNTFEGDTYAIRADSGKVRWRRHIGGTKPSSPAIDGPRLIISSQDGTVTALDRETGRVLWRVATAGKVESSPVVVDGLVYFGSHDGRLFAVRSTNGRIRWAYDTGGRINASPSVFGNKVCVTNYSGAIGCFHRRSGRRIWVTYVRRDAFRYESFYASPSTDGSRLYTLARTGKVVAVDASNGRIVWTARVGGLGYPTPAVANGRVFVGGFDGYLRAFRASTGDELWRAYVGGKMLGAPVVIGNLVFFSTIQKRTYAVRAADGKLVWRLPLGKYTPGIATEKTYYFSLNGRLIAFRGRDGPRT